MKRTDSNSNKIFHLFLKSQWKKTTILGPDMALDFFAGCLGGMGGVIVGHPFDTVKVLLQTQSTAKPVYNGTIHCLSTLTRKEGVRGVYRGLLSPLYGVALNNAILFGVYGNIERMFQNTNQYTAAFMSGAIAGFVQSPICCAIEMIKIQLQLAPGHCKYTTIDMYKLVYRQYGIRKGLFKGLNITVLREVPAFGSYFLTYELLTKSIYSNGQIPTLYLLLAGGVAGQVSWCISYPLDVIKTKLQSDVTNQYRGIGDCYRKLLRADGSTIFWRGLTPTLIRAFPTNAACFAVVNWTFRAYEYFNTTIRVNVMHHDSASAYDVTDKRDMWLRNIDSLRLCDNNFYV